MSSCGPTHSHASITPRSKAPKMSAPGVRTAVPREAASKHSNAGMISPSAKTSIRNRPPLISSTTFASRWAVPCCRSSVLGEAVDIRHWIFGWATTFGASTTATAPVAISTPPPASTMNRRRPLIALAPSPRDELVVGAVRHVVPGGHQRLEPSEGGVHSLGHRGLLGLLLHHLGGKLLEIAQHRPRELDHLDLCLELRLEPRERARVLRVEVRETVDAHRGSGMVERSAQIEGEALVRLLVEGELEHVARFLPARIVVVARGVVEAELHVVVRAHPFGGVDHAPLEGRVDVGGRGERRRAARPRDHLAAEARADPHLEPLVVADRVDLPPEPPGHLRRG